MLIAGGPSIGKRWAQVGAAVGVRWHAPIYGLWSVCPIRLFESLLHPFVIMFTAPLAAIGAILALLATNTSVSVVVFIGAILLVGIVVNNAIVLVDRVNRLRLEGMERRAAVIAGAHQRFRPIVMTTTTTVLGLLPMAIGLGEAAELRTPMAITVIGGLLIATLLTLVVIPVVYDLVDRKKIHGDVFEGGESPT